MQEAFAAAVEQYRAGGAAIAQIIAGAFSARRVVIAGRLSFHMIIVAIRFARRWRRRRRLLIPRVVARPPTHASIQTAKVPREYFAHRAQVDQQQRNPRQCVDYGDQPAPDRARCHATVSYGEIQRTLY